MQEKSFEISQSTSKSRTFFGVVVIPLVSLFIFTILLLQATAVSRIFCPPQSMRSLSFLRVLCPPALYPFLDYPMYNDPHFAGERIPQIELYGVLADSSSIRISPKDMGLNFWMFQEFLYAIDQGNRAQISMYVDLYQSRHTAYLVGLRMENHPWILTPEGARPGTPRVLKEISMDQRQGKAP